MDLRPTRLNCILQDLFRDTPLDHNTRPNMTKYAFLAQIWAKNVSRPFHLLWPLPISFQSNGPKSKQDQTGLDRSASCSGFQGVQR